jgi:hypothetical protein
MWRGLWLNRRGVCKALELATDPKRNFDIISMSWSILRNSDNSFDMDRIAASLKRAAETGKTVMFCAAPDSGARSTDKSRDYLPFGANLEPPALLKMAAATADGIPLPMAGPTFDFCLPGHEVEEAESPEGPARAALLRASKSQAAAATGAGGREGDMEREESYHGLKTGSSIATALGAGLAALLIHLVRLSVSYHARTGGDLTVKDLARIKDPLKIRRAFEAMKSRGGADAPPDRYIDVWDWFRVPADKLETLGESLGALEEDLRSLTQMKAHKTEMESLEKEVARKKDEMLQEVVDIVRLYLYSK